MDDGYSSRKRKREDQQDNVLGNLMNEVKEHQALRQVGKDAQRQVALVEESTLMSNIISLLQEGILFFVFFVFVFCFLFLCLCFFLCFFLCIFCLFYKLEKMLKDKWPVEEAPLMSNIISLLQEGIVYLFFCFVLFLFLFCFCFVFCFFFLFFFWFFLCVFCLFYKLEKNIKPTSWKRCSKTGGSC